MASIKADTLPISESLSENPRINYAKWKSAVLQYAVSNRINDFDLNRLLLSDAEWAIQFPPMDDGFGVFVPQPRLPVFASCKTRWKRKCNCTCKLAIRYRYSNLGLSPIIKVQGSDPCICRPVDRTRILRPTPRPHRP